MKKYVTSAYYDVESFILYKEVVTLISDEVIETIKSLNLNVIALIAKYASHGVELPPQITNLMVFFNQQFEQFKSLIISAEQGLDTLTNQWLQK